VEVEVEGSKEKCQDSMCRKSERIKHANAMNLQVTYTPRAAAEQKSSYKRIMQNYAKKNCGGQNPRTLNSSAFYKVKS